MTRVRTLSAALTIGAVLAVLAALVAGPIAPAQAATTLTLDPPSATEIFSVPMIAYSTSPTEVDAAATYGVSVGNVDPSKPLKMAARTQSTTQTQILDVQATPAGGTPQADGTWMPVPLNGIPVPWTDPDAQLHALDGVTGTVVASTPSASTNTFFFGASQAGLDDLVFYQEGPGGDPDGYDSATDSSASRINLTVMSVDSSSDVAVLTSPTPVAVGQRATSTIAMRQLSTVDVRGTMGAGDPRGVLGNAFAGPGGLNGRIQLTYAVGTAAAVPAKVSYDGLFTDAGGFPSARYSTASAPISKPTSVTATAKVALSAKRRVAVTDVGAALNLTTTASLVGEGKAQLSGTADPGQRVDIWAIDGYFATLTGEPGHLLGSRTADSHGNWKAGTTIHQTTYFYTRSLTKKSRLKETGVFSKIVALKAKALGAGKVRFTVDGIPRVGGYANVYDQDDVRIGHINTDRKGHVVMVVQSSPGRKTFRVYFQAPNCGLIASSLTGTVT